jgi:hypothetical protein
MPYGLLTGRGRFEPRAAYNNLASQMIEVFMTAGLRDFAVPHPSTGIDFQPKTDRAFATFM